MKIVNAGYRLVDDKSFKNPLQKIENIARICYKSEDLITEDSYKKMTKKLLDRRHLAMFEHASLAFYIDETLYNEITTDLEYILHYVDRPDGYGEINNFSRIHLTRRLTFDERFIVSGNIRAWIEFFENTVNVGTDKLVPLYHVVNDQIEGIMNIPYFQDVPYHETNIRLVTDYDELTVDEQLIHRTFTVVFTCDRGVTHELVRMRDASFAQESTRYCNYQLGKFGNEITVINPCFFEEGSYLYAQWVSAMKNAEEIYLNMLAAGAQPQEARGVLPTNVKADIALTTNCYEWRHIFNLRACDATGPAHPQMKEIMVPLFVRMRNELNTLFGSLELKADINTLKLL